MAKQTAQIAKQAVKGLGNETQKHTVTQLLQHLGLL